MKYVSAKHAALVAEYERIQAQADADLPPGRENAPWRIRSFVMAEADGKQD